ncbi:hypothetical protein SHKM778_94520 (plasmid) [Streptomyces sp. KM77-8]|uniref:Uncharacterized protein n=1 Tax=Streptomyces haneummycinicus TaxID=3074435 RepID=A0AAT9HZW0_9ACTN
MESGVHLVVVEKDRLRRGPYSQGAGARGELGPGGWLGWRGGRGLPRPVGHPEGYPEPGGAARPGRFAVAPRAWRPRRNPGTGEPARPTEGAPAHRAEPWRTPPGEAAAGGAGTAPDLRKCVIQITPETPVSGGPGPLNKA